MIISAATTGAMQHVIKTDILLEKTKCSVCLETRAVSLQLLTGVITPTILTILANHSIIGNLRVKVPYILTSGFLSWTFNILKKNSEMLMANACAQVALATGTIYLQQKEWENVTKIVLENVDLSAVDMKDHYVKREY